MTDQNSLFDLPEGRRRRDEALDRFASRAFVEESRQSGFQVAKRNGYVTTDDLHELYPEVPSGNYWGAVLRAPYFVKIGEVQSKRPEAHARNIHKWAIGPEWQKYR